jgi:pimeloyl-ACP methyl ester carboxylesterase
VPVRKVRSHDGTPIAFEQSGQGPPVILVGSAFNDRSGTAPLAAALAARCTVFNYDRRGRGDSGDTAPYAVAREVEDLDTLIAQAGGSAAVFAHSSGAVLALHAAAHGLAITKLALYEPPFLVDDSRPRPPADLPKQLAELIAAGRRGDAVELYQTKAVGIPADVVAQLRHAPFRPALEAIAHTLVYDATIIGDLTFPTELVASIATPTLVIDGENSMPMLHNAARVLADTLPNGRRCTLAGQTHEISPAATAPVLGDFFSS